MSRAKYTPGPWKAVIWKHPGHSDTVCVKDSDGREIIAWTGFDGVDCTKAEIRANARLAAAAPDLLAAARVVLAGMNARIDAADGLTPVFDGIAALHDAIGKAGGQS